MKQKAVICTEKAERQRKRQVLTKKITWIEHDKWQRKGRAATKKEDGCNERKEQRAKIELERKSCNQGKLSRNGKKKRYDEKISCTERDCNETKDKAAKER